MNQFNPFDPEGKCAPKSVEQMKDYQERMKKAGDLFVPAFKELLQKVEKEFDITFNLGLDMQNPYGITPTFIPRNIKVYEAPKKEEVKTDEQPKDEVKSEPGEDAPGDEGK